MSDMVVGKLNAAQFWEWREIIEEMLHSKTKAELMLTKHRLMEKALELEALRSQMFKSKVNDAGAAYKACEARYNSYKEKLEAELGISLNDKVIDELTFEVKEAPKSNDGK